LKSSEVVCEIIPFAYEYLDDVLNVENECFDEEDRYSRYIFEWFISKTPIFHLARCNGIVVGYVLSVVRRDTCYIESLAVRKMWRRLGLGERLIRKSLDECIVKGAKKAALEVATDNEVAINLYKKLGFKAKKVLKGYYCGKKDAYFMVKDLQPVV